MIILVHATIKSDLYYYCNCFLKGLPFYCHPTDCILYIGTRMTTQIMSILPSKSTNGFPLHSELNSLVYNLLQVLPPTSLTSSPNILSLGSISQQHGLLLLLKHTKYAPLQGFSTCFLLFIKCSPAPIWMVSSLNFHQVSVQMSSYGRMFAVYLSPIH